MYAQNMLDIYTTLIYGYQLHINLTTFIFMHFRQTCARTRIDKSLKLANYKLKRVTGVKFVGKLIDILSSFLGATNKSTQRKAFIYEYIKLYNALFKSQVLAHLMCCLASVVA